MFTLVSLIGVVFFQYNIKLPFKGGVALGCLIFVWLGFLYSNIKSIIKNPLLGIVLVIIGTLLNILNIDMGIESVEIVNLIIGNPLLFYLSASSLCIGFCILYETLINESTIMEFMGRNSMTIMICHYPIIYVVKNYIDLDIISQLAIISVIVCCICVFVNKIMPWSVNFKLLFK